MTKHIVIVGPAHPLRGGLATYNERLCREYMAMGYTTTLLTFKLQYPKILFPGKSQYADTPKPTDLNIDVALNSINPFNWISVGLKYKKLKPTVVIFRFWMPFMGPCLGTVARLIKMNKVSQCIAITDNIIPHEKRAGDSLFTQYFLKPMDGFVAMSKKVLEDISIFNRSKPRAFVPHPLYDDFGEALPMETAKQSLGLAVDANYLLFFGFIRKYKGLDLLLNAFAKMDYVKHNAFLIVAGEFYEEAQPYLDLIEKLGIADRVILKTDFIPNNQVAQYFSAADMVVQTYKTATQSGVTQIAYFYDKPMLVTNVGGLAELVPHLKVGYVCEQNPEDIAQQLNAFYENQSAAAFIENILIEKEKFSWRKLAEQILKL